jgi:hypothetical protein
MELHTRSRGDAQAEDEYERAVSRIDGAFEGVSRGTSKGAMAVESIASAVETFATDAFSTAADLQLLVEYALELVRCVADLVRDRALVDYVDQRLGFFFQRPALRAELRGLLESLAVRLEIGDHDAATEVEELCRHAGVSHRHLLATDGAGRSVLELAHRFELVEALAAAVRPTSPGRIGHHVYRHPSCLFALDCLAHLAADPGDAPYGDDARRTLVDLVDYLEIAGEAAIRLPLHLLSDSDRAALAQRHEHRLEVLHTDPVIVPLDVASLRDSEVIRTQLFQAMDASRMR